MEEFIMNSITPEKSEAIKYMATVMNKNNGHVTQHNQSKPCKVDEIKSNDHKIIDHETTVNEMVKVMNNVSSRYDNLQGGKR